MATAWPPCVDAIIHNSDAGATPVPSRWSRARVQAIFTADATRDCTGSEAACRRQGLKPTTMEVRKRRDHVVRRTEHRLICALTLRDYGFQRSPLGLDGLADLRLLLQKS